MGRRDGPNFIDYTLLKKRGLLKLPEIKSQGKVTSDGYVEYGSDMVAESNESLPSNTSTNSATDFWSMGTNTASPENTQTATDSSSPFGFLDNAASSSNAGSYYGSSSGESSSSDLNALRLKLEDAEYKLERALERIAVLESKINRD